MSERVQIAAFVMLLLCVGSGAWLLELRPTLEVETSALATLPYDIQSRSGHDVVVDAKVREILQADFHVQRTYLEEGEPPIWLYIGYYGTERGGYTPHTPDACYPAAGWTIDEAARTTRALLGDLRVNEIQVTSAGDRRLVQYWYRSHRATGILGATSQALDRVIGRLLHSRADGGFIRVSTPMEDADVESARQRLEAFANELDSLLANHWPAERATL